jgi:hypothetical protein
VHVISSYLFVDDMTFYIKNFEMAQDWKKNIKNVKVPSIFVKMMGIQNMIFYYYFGVLFIK